MRWQPGQQVEIRLHPFQQGWIMEQISPHSAFWWVAVPLHASNWRRNFFSGCSTLLWSKQFCFLAIHNLYLSPATDGLCTI